jgi:hypothetical protein
VGQLFTNQVRFLVMTAAPAGRARASTRPLLPVAALAATLLLLVPAARAASSANLLAGQRPFRSQQVTHAGRLTDGTASHEGDPWLTNLTARLTSERAFVEYDLGRAQAIGCAFVQADAGDLGLLSGSADGQSWLPLWRIGPGWQAGMSTRSTTLAAKARYLRLSAADGRAIHAVAELAVYADCSSPWPAQLRRERGLPAGETVDTEILIFGLLAAAFLLLQREGASRWQYLLGLPALVSGSLLALDLVELFDFNREPALRALVASLAGVLLVKESFFVKRWVPQRRVVWAALSLCALGAVGSYVHFGVLQFFDQQKGRRTFVHTFDMRHYFPVAKYFGELGYDGLYLASLAAYLDDTPAFTPDRLAEVRIRDLRTSEIRRGSDLTPELAQIRSRFSPARWHEFRRDMGYFAAAMGPADYLGSLGDHGANASPVWLLLAHLLFRSAPASELALTLTGLIDPLLLVVLFVALVRVFGWRTTLYVAVIFGATDFHTFTANLVGSTLRQDWLVALGLGICALVRRRHFWAGVLLAYSGLVRAFPAVAGLFLLVPVAWSVVEHVRATRRLPPLSLVRARHTATLRALAGALLCTCVLVCLTTLTFGFRASWGAWQDKIARHATDPSTNNVGLRNLLAFASPHSAQSLVERDEASAETRWVEGQRSTFAARRPWFYAILSVLTALVLLACRGRPPAEAALGGLLLVPFAFYPSNYYCHFVFLLPLIAAGPRGPQDRSFAWVYLVLVALCVGQALTLHERWIDLRYTYQSLLLVVAFSVIAAYLAWRSRLARLDPSAAQ